MTGPNSRDSSGASQQAPGGVSVWVKALTWAVRLAIGAVFVFSGIVKCIDPWGTLYKLYDYFAAMGLDFLQPLGVPAAFALAIVEFMTGIFLVFGCFRRFTPWLLAVIMLVMLPLTLWIAVADPVADCGCFGDALIISNWATFWKNVAISAGAVWLLYFNRKCGWLIRPYVQWTAVVATGLYAGVVAWFGYDVQPLLDFRPYPVGEKIYDGSGDDSGSPEFTFVYEKNGEEREFGEDDVLPDEEEGWRFVRREEKNASPVSDAADRRNLKLWGREDDSDVTAEVLGNGGRQILVLLPSLKDASVSYSYTLNSMREWASAREIDMVAAVAADQSETEAWSDLWMPAYPVVRAEDTSIKEVARGNPAVVYLEDGTVRWKRTLRSLPVQDFMDEETPSDPMAFDFCGPRFLLNISLIYGAVMAVFILISFVPALYRVFTPSRRR